MAYLLKNDANTGIILSHKGKERNMPKVQTVSIQHIDVDNTVNTLAIVGKMESAQSILNEIIMDIEGLDSPEMESTMGKKWFEDAVDELDTLTSKIRTGVSGAMKAANKMNSESVEKMIEDNNGFVFGHKVGKKSEKELDEAVEMVKKLLGLLDDSDEDDK